MDSSPARAAPHHDEPRPGWFRPFRVVQFDHDMRKYTLKNMKTKLIIILGLLSLVLAVVAEDWGVIGIVLLDRKSPQEPVPMANVIPGSPAERAGFKSNLFLISVNGTNVVSMSITQATSMVRGPIGTSVTIELANAALSSTNKFTVKRERVVFSKDKVEFLEK